MNINNACDILELSYPFTVKELKKAYYKQSLKFHPDKNKNNIEDSTIQFHKILDSYKFLNEYLNLYNNNDFQYDIDKSYDYEYLLKKFINSLQIFYDTNTDITNIILDIINNCKTITTSTFENLDNNTIIRLIGYIEKYYDLFNLNKETIKNLRNIFEKKIECNDSLYILKPSIDNLFNNDIYILDYMNDKYYIPLWHDELTYETKDTTLIVKCIPKLPEHIYIDDLNNINVYIKLIFENTINKEIIPINIGNKVFEINTCELKLKKNQLYVFKNMGISCIDINNIYNIKTKSDIIIHINLVK